MKLFKVFLFLFLLGTGYTVWSGTTRVVLQNAGEGGYQGCRDTWLDSSLTVPNGNNDLLFLLYELCAS